MKQPDYYEFLQISPNAEPSTIQRVYKFLAARFHPDNPDSGDAEKFALLKQAYDVLSDAAQRTQYDASRDKEAVEAIPIPETMDFLDSIDGELNRRMAMLAVLYKRRRTNATKPEVSLGEIESLMNFPRDYLDFTVWYLLKKGFVTRADNSALTLTAEGVDFVEEQRANVPNLSKLLTSGTGPSISDRRQGGQIPDSRPAFTERRDSADRRK
ncbi:MAG: DnaJ domain-containing protein [Terracidiphilus sp.]